MRMLAAVCKYISGSGDERCPSMTHPAHQIPELWVAINSRPPDSLTSVELMDDVTVIVL